MKRNKIYYVLLSFLMVFAVALGGCSNNTKPSYKAETKESLRGLVEMALPGTGLPEEEADEIIAIIESSLKEANISDKELQKLLDLPAVIVEILGEYSDIEALAAEISVPVEVPVAKELLSALYDTGVTNTKIATFIYVITVESYTYLKDNDYDVEDLFGYGASYELLDEAINCVKKKDFVNIVVATLDTLKTTVNAKSVDDLFALVELVEDREEMPTAKELKTILNQAIKDNEKVNAIWSDKVLNSTVTIAKNFVNAFMPNKTLEERTIRDLYLTLIDEAIDTVKVFKKVEIAVLKAIDEKMIEALLEGAYSTDVVVIVCAKLINAAITGGLTKKFVEESTFIQMLFLQAGADIGGLYDMLKTESAKYKNRGYDYLVDYDDDFVIFILENFTNYYDEYYPVDYNYYD